MGLLGSKLSTHHQELIKEAGPCWILGLRNFGREGPHASASPLVSPDHRVMSSGRMTEKVGIYKAHFRSGHHASCPSRNSGMLSEDGQKARLSLMLSVDLCIVQND